MSAHQQPSLQAGDLSIRPWSAADAPAVVRAYEDPDIQRWHVRTMEPDEALAWTASWAGLWDAETAAGWAVADSHDDALLGRMVLHKIDLTQGVSEVAYWVVPAARGRGVASRSLEAVTRWAFDHMGLHRIQLDHSTKNPASCRVALKAGFHAEGTLRSQLRHADGWHDMHVHALLNHTRVV